MAEPRVKNLTSPDETREFPGLRLSQVDLGDHTVGRMTLEPGWRWYTHVRPEVGGEWCEARHVGVVISGRFGIVMRDGTALEFGPDDVFEIPAGHDGYTIGDEPCVQIEWTGLRAFAGFRLMGATNRALVTLLFTDLVDSTVTANRLGDQAWRDLLSTHYEMMRSELERHNGREVNTTGDGLLATFDGPAGALRCASAIRSAAGAPGAADPGQRARRRGRARRYGRARRRGARSRADHECRRGRGDPRVEHDARAGRERRPHVRGARHPGAERSPGAVGALRVRGRRRTCTGVTSSRPLIFSKGTRRSPSGRIGLKSDVGGSDNLSSAPIRRGAVAVRSWTWDGTHDNPVRPSSRR